VKPEANTDRITFGALVRGVVGGLGSTGAFNKGLVNLVRAKADRLDSIGNVIESLAERYPDRVALKFEDRRWTYREFNAWVNRYVEVFRAKGVQRADVVGIYIENHPQVLACVAAAVKLGAIAGMLNYNQREHVLLHSLKLIKPRLLIAGSSTVEGLMPLLADIEREWRPGLLWVATEKDARCMPPFADLEELARVSAEANPPETSTIPLSAPCYYIFTSGTTGLPKASIMTHLRWMKVLAGVGQMAVRLNQDDVLYCALPLYHNNALTVSWSATLGAGAALALDRKFSATRFWERIRHFEATAFCYIGELCRYLLNQPPGSQDRDHRVRVIVGNGLRPEIWDEFKSRFGIGKIAEFYAASEGNVAFVNGFGLDRTAGFCPLPYAIVEFDADLEQPRKDPDGRLVKVQPGGIGLLIGEVTEKSPYDGYTDAAASEKKLIRNAFADGDCWFNTGDLVRDQGFRHIQFVDRVGDTFRWKGEDVATTEVEGVLGAFPQVEQAVVYGVMLPNADGRAGMATLILKHPGQPLDGMALAQHLSRELPGYAIPLFLRIVEKLETTGTFKVRKVDLKNQGFDPAVVADPLYALLDTARGYEPLTPQAFSRIVSGEVKL
jgi:acyl-CoA synthetase (AMP-forming)/AMP-acid ligase II